MTQPARNWNPWPYGIATALAVFAGLVVTLVTLAVRHPPQLVAKDYYEQELRYQDDIDRRTRATTLTAGLQVKPDAAANRIVVTFPLAQARQGVTGTVRFYRPSDAGLDRTIVLALDAQGTQEVATTDLLPGLWQLKVEWSSGGQEFAATEKVRIPRRDP